jgi:hypothetical protein
MFVRGNDYSALLSVHEYRGALPDQTGNTGYAGYGGNT